MRSFGREATVKRDYVISSNLLWRKNLYATLVGMMVERSFWMMFFIWQAAVWLCGGYHVINGTMTAGEVVVFITFADWMFRPIFMMMDSLSSMQTSLACVERTFDLLDERWTLLTVLRRGGCRVCARGSNFATFPLYIPAGSGRCQTFP